MWPFKGMMEAATSRIGGPKSKADFGFSVFIINLRNNGNLVVFEPGRVLEDISNGFRSLFLLRSLFQQYLSGMNGFGRPKRRC